MSIPPLTPDLSPPDPSPSQPSPPEPDPTTRWRLVEELFHRSAELPTSERPAFLEQACSPYPDHAEILADVLDLLRSDSDVAEKVEAQRTPASDPNQPPGDAEPDSEALPFRTSPDSWLNRRLGHYIVQQELGRGGMGVVYLGRRTTPGPHQQAAIKVVRRNLQESPALNHFLLERDALARLEHPNIARLLDGGVTPQGIPWLALEYVEGQRLDHHVEVLAQAGELTVQTIVGLILQLCAAVGYVHRNLILHRDLKPGNVMVTLDGARGHTVKLLDFGTLKILANDEASAMTQAGMRPVTLRFASPEHVLGQRVSTASDVYSLGIILYRLIAGRFPEPSPESSPDPIKKYCPPERRRRTCVSKRLKKSRISVTPTATPRRSPPLRPHGKLLRRTSATTVSPPPAPSPLSPCPPSLPAISTPSS